MSDKNDDEMSRHDVTTNTSRNLDIAMIALDKHDEQNPDDTVTSSDIMSFTSKISDTNHTNHICSSNTKNDIIQNQNSGGIDAVVTKNNDIVRNNDIDKILKSIHQTQEVSIDTTTNSKTYYPPDVVTNEHVTPATILNREHDIRRKPGAVPVRGINEESESSLDSCMQSLDHSLLETSSGVIGPTALEVDGYLPGTEVSNNENNYRVLAENIQRIEHMYASDEVPSSLDNHNVDLQTNMKLHQSMKQYMKKHCFLILLMILLMSAVIIGSVCGSGKCNKNNNDIQDNTVNQDNTINQDKTANQDNTIKYQSFYTKTELIDAVNKFISGENSTLSLEETYGSISYWNVSSIQDFSHLFDALTRNNKHRNFNEDLSRWDVSSATNMSFMFNGAGSFRGDISKWNVLRVTDMSYFMAKAKIFNSDLSLWDTSQIINASRMFHWANNFTGDGLEYWNTSNMIDTNNMFRAASSFRGNLSKWDMSRVIEANGMFAYTPEFDSDLSSWDVSAMKSML